MNIDNILQSGEEEIYCTKYHWISLSPLILFLILLLISIFIEPFLFLFLLFVYVIYATISWLYYNNNIFIITNRRVIRTRGILGKDIVDRDLNSIEYIRTKSNLLGNILNYGTVYIALDKTTSRSTSIQNKSKQFILAKVPDTLLVKKLIDENIRKIKPLPSITSVSFSE